MLYKNEKSFIDSGKKFSLIYGNDDGKVKNIADNLASHLNLETIKISIDDLNRNTALLANTLLSGSLFAVKQLVILNLGSDNIKPQIVKNIVQTISETKDLANDIIITGGQLNKSSALRKLFESDKDLAIFACYESSPKDIEILLMQKLQEQNLTISADAKQYFIQKTAGNYARLIHEIEKLLLYKDAGAHIEFEDVVRLTGQYDDSYLSDLIYPLFSGNLQKLRQKLQETEIETIPLLFAIRRHLSLLTEIQVRKHTGNKNIHTVVSELRPPIFFKLKEDLIKQANRWHQVKLLKFYTKSLDIEYQIKYTPIIGENNAKMLLLEIARAA